MTIDALIALLLGNVPLVGLVLAVLAPLCLESRLRAERLLGYLLILGLGVPMVWAAYYHLARPDMAARLIGWAPSPFQREIGLADLAMGAVACVAASRPLPFKGAIVWTLALALGGDAVGHIQEIVRAHDLAPGNAGPILWWDMLAPLYALVLLVAANGRGRAA